jgi:Tol biopolymer transport system component
MMRFDRLDRAALLAIAGLAVLIILLLLRGDQVGAQAVRLSPEAGAQGVSTRATIALTFDEPMDAASVEQRLRITPDVSGTLRWNGRTVTFVPQHALQSDSAYTVSVAAGAHSERGRSLLRDVTWSFRTGHPRVVYLSPVTGNANLLVSDIDTGGETRRITDEPLGVYDFAVSPDGQRIAYSADRDQTGARDLWLVNADGSGRDRLVDCAPDICQNPSWSADGARLAYERRTMVQGSAGLSAGPARVWLLDLTSRSAALLLADSQQLGTLPRWAPDGNRLAYYDPQQHNIMVLDVASGERTQLPSTPGDPGAWSPDGTQLIYPELEASDIGAFNQLLRADLVAGVITPVMALSTTNDSSVAWSPDGALIAFSRQRGLPSQSGGFTPFGAQMWVSAADGSSAHALTDESEYNFGGLAWSPDGEWIAAVRNSLLAPNPQPEVWIMRRDGSAIRAIAQDATLPFWLP